MDLRGTIQISRMNEELRTAILYFGRSVFTTEILPQKHGLNRIDILVGEAEKFCYDLGNCTKFTCSMIQPTQSTLIKSPGLIVRN